MRLTGTIIGIILILLGSLWALQGSNVLAGSMMSGQSLWLWIGIVVAVVGVVMLLWARLRKI